MTAIDRLTALDASFLLLERPGLPIHVGSVATFEAAPLLDEHGELPLQEIRTEIEARLDDLPRLRRRISWSPLGLLRPAWVDDPAFDIVEHVDAVRLDGADDDALRSYAAEVMTELLPRDRPLWHIRFVVGLTGDRVALIERVHHALVDGVSGVDVAAVLLDLTPDVARRPTSRWRPAGAPSAWSLAAGAVRAPFSGAAAALRISGRALVRPDRSIRRGIEVAGAVATVLGDGLVAPRSPLNVPVGASRTLLWVRTRLDDVKAAGRAEGATANDVVLTAVAEGCRELLLRRGEILEGTSALKVLVPVSLRDEAARGTLGNQVGALLLRLPIGIADPAERLRTIGDATARLKQRREATTTSSLLHLADLVPAPVIGPLARSVHQQRMVNLVVTNVPGSPVPLYSNGARMLEAFPVVPLGGNLALGVAILSYDGALNLGITADPDACPDADVFRAGVERGFTRLGAPPQEKGPSALPSATPVG